MALDDLIINLSAIIEGMYPSFILITPLFRSARLESPVTHYHHSSAPQLHPTRAPARHLIGDLSINCGYPTFIC